MESILTSIKKLLGVDEDDENFDVDICMCINGALFDLIQIGVGPPGGFAIKDKNSKWSEFLGDGVDFEKAKTLVYLKTKLAFDPPESTALLTSIKEQINESEFRLTVQIDSVNSQTRTSD